MSFSDMVSEKIKTKEQFNSEQMRAKIETENKIIYDAAEWNYTDIKKQILEQASCGDHNNGYICGMKKILFLTGSYYDGDLPCGYPISAKQHQTRDRHGGIFRFHDVHHISVDFEDTTKLLAMYRVMVELGNQDGVSIGEPFLYATVSDMKTRKLLRDHKTRITKGKLKCSLKYHTYLSSGVSSGEVGSIVLAVEYEYHA